MWYLYTSYNEQCNAFSSVRMCRSHKRDIISIPQQSQGHLMKVGLISLLQKKFFYFIQDEFQDLISSQYFAVKFMCNISGW